MENNTVIILYTRRSCYSPEQDIDSTMTVGELINALSYYDEDTKIMFANDNGYTYGYMETYDIAEIKINDDDDDGGDD